MDRLLLFIAVACGPAGAWFLLLGEAPPPLLWLAGLFLAFVTSWYFYTVSGSTSGNDPDERERIARWLARQRGEVIGPDWTPAQPPDDPSDPPAQSPDDPSGPPEERLSR